MTEPAATDRLIDICRANLVTTTAEELAPEHAEEVATTMAAYRRTEDTLTRERLLRRAIVTATRPARRGTTYA